MCVAEVITFAEPERNPLDGSLPEWFLGTVDWNGRQLPVVSFDGAVAPPAEGSKKRGRTRIVVFHAIGEALKSGFYGVLSQGFPQLVRVNPDVLTAEEERNWQPGQPVLCRVRMIHEYPLIPDLERVEQMVAELRLAA
jgi:chemosensory pili system protein ChpC